MKKFILCMTMLLTVSISSFSQNVVKQGNIFTQVSSPKSSSSKATKTKYIYKDSKGKEYPIYLTAKGKAYILRVSSKTGKEYKQYLPEVSAQLAKEK